jgi:hypothetical protein
MSWHNIVFLQGEEADKVFEMIFDIDGVVWRGPYAERLAPAVEHLAQWDNGDESEHSPTDEPEFGPPDDTFEHNGYTLAWNTHHGYVSLNRETEIRE